MHPKTISGPFKRYRNEFQAKMNGLIFGIVIGDALGLPFNDIQPGGKLQIKGKEIDYIDKIYFPDIGFQDKWPVETTLALSTCRALIDIWSICLRLRIDLFVISGKDLSYRFVQACVATETII